MIHTLDFKHTVIDLFEYQVEKNPELVAIKDIINEYTYERLNSEANQIAHYLKTQSVQPDDFVALLLEPSTDFIICLIAIIKLGAVYVPLDTLAPKTRLKELLEDTQPKLIITNEFFEHLVKKSKSNYCLIHQLHNESARYQTTNHPREFTPESALYMIYTSGSTGRPKGVIVPHRAIVNMAFIDNTIKLKAGKTMGQFSNVAFDGSSYEIWTTLLNGATLFIVPTDARFNHSKLKKTLLKYGVTSLFLPTSFLHQLIQSAPNVLDTIESIMVGGEQINATLIEKLIEYRRINHRKLTLINGYGPTETSAYICRQVIDTQQDYDKTYLESIGQLIANTRAYILDDNLNQVSEGELYISGINLAIGYHQCELQNKEKFIANPFSQDEPYERLYKTGDKVRKLDSGNLLYLGRYDDQVKVGGFRVHLNEIEAALMKHPKVMMASVNVELSGGVHKTLTAYIVFLNNEITHAEELRDFIKKTLPAYMLPTKWLKISKLPLTRIGKVDKSKLEKIPHTDLSLHTDASSESSIEEQIKNIWKELLNQNTIDPNKNLFDLGANSLLITDACTKINNMLQTELKIGDLISHPTIHRLSRYIEGDVDLITIKKRRKAYSSDIAIVGMSCRFPGADNLDDFWKQLCEGKESLYRFDGDSLQNSTPNYIPVRGILSEIDLFDASFFGFNAIEASLADPQQRLLLECTWHALEHAGIAPNKAPDKIISMFAGMTDSTYLQENLLKSNLVTKDHDALHQRIASSTSMLSTQISYRLNLKGRSINVNTACSTGLLVVDQACQDLVLGYSDVAIAGAASIVVPQNKGYSYQIGSITSEDGHCRPFSEQANGTVFSNGVGVVILKRLKDAIQDKDTIYAVIKGRGINNDGADKLGFTAPSMQGQMICINNALEEAHLNPEEIGYVEAHGTATELGDLIELNALHAVYKEQTTNRHYCALGSVKANIGHTDVVAGIAGLIKTALCLYHHKIPPLIHYTRPNPLLGLDDSPFFINQALINWNTGLKKRYAAISSFGVGGTNAHMILSEQDAHSPDEQITSIPQLFILSAKKIGALKEQITNLLNTIPEQNTPISNLTNIAYTLQTGREDFSWRSFAVGSCKKDILKEFNQHPPLYFEENSHESIIFMFPGQGSQCHGMAMELYRDVPHFAATINKGVAIANSLLNINLLELINNSNKQEIHLTQFAQPALFIIEYALAQLLINYGIKPDALIGHSLGEYVAACVAGVFSFEEGVELICKRGLLMSEAPIGAMLSVECTNKVTQELKEQFDVELALHNSSSHYIFSGTIKAITQLELHLNSIQVPCKKLQVSHAFHSRSMESIKEPFLKLFDSIDLKSPAINIVSNVTGEWLAAEQIVEKGYWYEQLRHTVKLHDGLKTALNDTRSFFIEVGVGQTLNTFLHKVAKESSLKNQPHSTHLLPNRNKKTSDRHQLLTAIGHAWQLGVPIQWSALYNNSTPEKSPLPPYPFQKQRYWIEPDPTVQSNHPQLFIPAWSRKPLSKDYPILPKLVQNHSWIIFKDDSHLSTELISLLQHHKAQVLIIESSSSFEKVNSHHFKINPGKKEHYVQCITRIKKHLKSPRFIHLYSLNTPHLDSGFYSLMYLSQSFIELLGVDYAIKGLVLTQGTQKITGMESSIPVNACIHGACQVICKEYPAFEIRSIDIDSNELNSKNNISFLINKLIQPWDSYFTARALRKNACWELGYQNISSIPEHNPFKNNGVYFITGGIGGIALALCEVITSYSQNPHLILISRSPVIKEAFWEIITHDSSHPQHQQINALVKLKDAGALIHWHQVDITDATSLSSLVAHYKKQLGSFNGLIHAAGVAGGGIIPLKTFQDANQILAPKLDGTNHLAAAFKNIPMDFVVLMSSLVALVGEPGQIDYAAANAALNTFATADIFHAHTVVSINWNTWNDIGMAVKESTHQRISFLNRGNDISPQQGKEIFLKILQSGYSQVAVSNYELQHHEAMVAHSQKSTINSSTKMARETLEITRPYSPPQNKFEEQLATLWQNTLGIEAIGIDDDFFEIGGYSLNALQIIDKTNKHFKCSMSIQQLYKYTTIRELSLLLHEGMTQQVDIVVPLNQLKEQPPYLFLCHPASGMIYCFNAISEQLADSMSVFGVQDPSITKGTLLFKSVIDMARQYLKAIKTIQPKGPYYLMGYSFGGTIVYEMAHILNQENEDIALLALIDSWSLFSEQHQDKERFINEFKKSNQDLSNELISLAWARMRLLLEHQPTQTHQEMILFKATNLIEEYKPIDHPVNGWSKYNQGKIYCCPIKANHNTILNNQNSSQILNILNKKGYFCK